MLKKFNLENIKIRKISQSDLKRVREFQKYINSLIEEEAMILLKKKKGYKEEEKWLKEELKNVKNKKEIMLIAEDNNKIVGISAIKLREERQNHIGELGISIKKEYRGMGLGKKLMAKVLELARKELRPRPKIIRLSVLSENKIAQNLYKKFGFKIVAKIPKQIQYKGRLLDEIIMIKKM